MCNRLHVACSGLQSDVDQACFGPLVRYRVVDFAEVLVGGGGNSGESHYGIGMHGPWVMIYLGDDLVDHACVLSKDADQFR
ncbi:hypothetical protein K227x_55140 [Rubripirellula lacrimiformis]|uniref:Uncharacterized protein n=1 Tax=Rubripirellula lacrimiformis TaxID=1930273 RepID=A0A517NIX4_9BACT|nr:hypothetical protein K227x_55140 [Rubripirellula lacrimiformis]